MSELAWQKSSYSGQGANCLYLAIASDETVRLRESTRPDVVLAVSRDALRALIRGVKAGEWDNLV
ncbi:DUF397 domain-containing protein [Streptomyces sp. S07_1.15]|uniref:DUF397 domain-containing protein n=1 Tax=Streptomyces sp. S07_1.15 TaxID=2873925 RepID=UPI001D13D8B6|nr:DUF397 domain-containing protein [Streptomyces sp. S07_1.15]MCC3653820.1 DUF397 domain-containing protein [Streptomyces sp. S07_1.15]